MSCMFDKDLIQKYADNTIDPLEYIFLKEHIGYCEECRKETELSMALESVLESFFSNAPGEGSLSSVITGLVDDCMYELNWREKLKFSLGRRIAVSKSVFNNSTRFLSMLPGGKRLKRNTKRSSSGIGSILRTFMKKRVKKLLDGVSISL